MDKKSKSAAHTPQSPHVRQALYPNAKGFMPGKHAPVGGVILGDGEIEYNLGRPAIRLTVRNTGDRPIQIGSHFHFFEVNRYLEFDRAAAFGTHLNIPATTAIRFEPGDSKEVEVVSFGGKQRIIGFSSLVDGYTGCEDTPTYYPTRDRSIHRMKQCGFKHSIKHGSKAEATEQTENIVKNQPIKSNDDGNNLKTGV